jgi:hypothetical protein
MLETKENRTAAVLNTLSDSSTDPIEAVTIQAAYGAPQLEN